MLRTLINEAGKPVGRIEPGDFLIIEAFDRLSRLPAMEAYEIAKEILALGIIIVTLNNGVEYSLETLKHDQGKMFVLFGDLYAANNYSSNLSRRSKGAHERVRQTLLNGGKIKHKCPFWLSWEPATREYVINEHGKLVKEVWELRAKPNHGYASIAIHFNAKGYRCPHPKGWENFIYRCLYHVHEVLGSKEIRKPNPTTGKQEPVGVVEDYYPAVIDRKTFNRAMQLREKETFWRTGKKPARDYPNILSGLVKCGECGQNCHAYQSRKPKVINRYITCRNRRKNKSCPNGISVRMDHLETRIIDHITRELAASDLLNDQQVTRGLESALLQIRLEEETVKTLTDQIDTLATSLADPSIVLSARKVLLNKLNELSTDLMNAEAQLGTSKKEAAFLQQTISVAGESLDKVKKLMRREDPDQRRALRSAISSLVNKIVVVSLDCIRIQFRTGVLREIKLTRFEPVALGMVKLHKTKQVYASDIDPREIDSILERIEGNEPSC